MNLKKKMKKILYLFPVKWINKFYLFYNRIFYPELVERKMSFGEKNEDKIFYVIRPRKNSVEGLMALLFYVIQQIGYAEKNNYIPVVDFKNYKTQYNIADENAWECFFEQISNYSLEEVYQSKNVVLSGINAIYDTYSYLYNKSFNEDDLQKTHLLAKKYIKFSKKAYELYNKELKHISPQKNIGLYLRGTDYINLKPIGEPIQPTVAQIFWEFIRFKLCVDIREDCAILVFASTAAYLFNFCHSKKYIRLRLTRNPNIKKHIKPIVVIFAMSVATTIYVNSDTTMLGGMAGNYYVGLYNAATKIYTVMKSLMAACILVSLPRLSNYLAIEEYAEYSEKASSILNGFLTFLPPIVIGVFMTAPQIISILAGKSFLDATISLRILCISLFFSIVAVYMTNVVLLPLKKEKQIMYATFASAIINLLLNFIFIPLWKQTGAAITTVVAEIVVMLWQVCAYKKSDHCIELRLNKSNLKAIFIACCVIILICVSVDTFQMKFIVAFFVKVILAIISYIIILVVLHHTIALKVIEFIRNCLKK